MSGKLFIVSTPIGNLGDISPRVKQALNESTLVLAEDTRVSGKLLHHLGLNKRLLSCHDFNESKRLHLLEEVKATDGAAAIMSDAGTPLVSDPGFQIVRKAIALGLQIVPIPGPSALLAALVGSGLPCDRFAFEGFLPDKNSERRKRLASLADDERTLIFYVAPHNLPAVLQDMLSAFGDRPACLARELTKLYEEFRRQNLADLLAGCSQSIPRGEIVVVVGGKTEQGGYRLSQEELSARLQELLNSGGRLKDIASMLAKETGWSASEIYKLGLDIKEGRVL